MTPSKILGAVIGVQSVLDEHTQLPLGFVIFLATVFLSGAGWLYVLQSRLKRIELLLQLIVENTPEITVSLPGFMRKRRFKREEDDDDDE